MGDDAAETDQDVTPPKQEGRRRKAPRRRPRRLLRAGVTLLSSAIFVMILGGALLTALVGQQLDAPDWLRRQIEERLERNLNGTQIDFGGMEFVVNQGWRPRIRLRDVVLENPDGVRIAEMTHAEASLAMRPLLKGHVQPKRIAVSGVFATLRRDPTGAVSLQLADTATPVGQAEGLPQLIESWDQLLLLPNLSALVAVDVDAITLRYEDVRQGRGWTLDGGLVQLARTDNDLRLSSSFSLLSGRDFASLIEANYSGRIGDTTAEFGISAIDIPASDIAAQNPAVGWLSVLRAPISGAIRGGIDSQGAFGPVSATLQIGSGVLQPTEQSRPIRFDGARTYFTFSPDSQELRFDELSVNSEWISGISEGRAVLAGIENGTLTELVGQFSTNTMHFNPDGLLPEPLVPKATSFDFRLELNPFRFTLGQAAITDQAGQINLSGELTADDAGWHMALDGQMDRLTPERLMQFWPERAAPKPRKWVSENVLDGIFSEIDFALRLEPEQRPLIAVDWTFADTSIRFNRFQPPITGAFGQASILGDRLSITATSGEITAEQGGDIAIGGTSFIVPDMSIKPFAPAIVRAQAKGAITAVLSLLNRPPLAVLKDTEFPVDLADGQADVTGTLALTMRPKVPYEALEFDVNGVLSGVDSTVLVPGQDLQADRLNLHVNQGQVTLSGPGQIGDLPVNVRWRQALGPQAAGQGSIVDGTVELSERTIQTFDIGLPPGSVGGQGTARFVLQFETDQPPSLTVTSDLDGVSLAVPQVGWRKRAETTGSLELDIALDQPVRVDQVKLDAPGLAAIGSVSTRADGGLGRARLGSVRLGQWLNGSVELVGRGAAPPEVWLNGGTVNLQALPDTQAGNGSAPVHIAIDRLEISPTLALTDFKGTFTSSASGLSGPYTGRLNGQTPVNGRIVPQEGGTAIEMFSDDGGGVFRSAGILNQAHGGPLELKMVPNGPDGHFSGSLKVTNTRIKDAPVMAAMLNAISVVGLIDEMTGQGILFSEVEAKFRLDPKQLTILNSSAIGPSIGLSLDGSYDIRSHRVGFRGVISPVYLLNVVGSVFTPRKGEGMIGFNYTLTGPADDPHLEVNPLSGLAPGLFREIFRGQSAPDPTRDTQSRDTQSKEKRPEAAGAGDR